MFQIMLDIVIYLFCDVRGYLHIRLYVATDNAGQQNMNSATIKCDGSLPK